MDESLIALLRCPKSGLAMGLNNSQLVSVDGQEHYPLMQGIPWLLKNPLHSMVDWSVKLNHFQSVLIDEAKSLENDCKTASGPSLLRLRQLLEGKLQFIQQVSKLVSPVTSTKVSSKPVYDALSDRVPATQNLLSYEANLYRDWVWGQEENAITAELIVNQIQNNAVEKMLVLGAGASRLAYDVHMSIQPKLSISSDINPLLVFAAQQVLHGPGLTITEFPMQPRSTKYVAVTHKVPPVENPPNNFHFLFSDAATPALQRGAFDLVLTPWLIDIQPHELTKFLRAINHYLPIGGEWINFGSLVFNQKRDALCYAIEEVSEIAQRAGFEITSLSEHEIPYLKSPYNAGWRMERIFCWRAIKTQEVKLPLNLQNLPNWILNPDNPIPLTKEIRNFNFSHKIYAQLSGNINGKRTLNQIASRIAKEQSMDRQEALTMIKDFYMKMLNLK